MDPIAKTQDRLAELEQFRETSLARLRVLEDKQLVQGKFTGREALKVAATTVVIAVPLTSIVSGLILFTINTKVLHDPVTLENRLTKLEASAETRNPSFKTGH